MGKKILVVDDEPDIVKIVSFRLKKEGYEVVIAVDGQEGLDKAGAENPDLTLLDLRLTKMSGEEVCGKIKSDDKLKHIPVVFLTASHVAGVMEKVQEFGAQDYLVKPFDPKGLLEKVRKYIG